MATPDTIALGVGCTPQARIAAVMYAKRNGASVREVIADVDLVLSVLPDQTDVETRRGLWRAAIVGVYGRRAVQLYFLEQEGVS